MYESLSAFAQTWGMLIFITLFALAGAYALWPKNQSKFEEAARTPLDDSERPAAADDEDPSGEKDRTHG